ncbi:hypothetical protein [Lederbergia lenta]|uniref:Uncharacterized protein n=1 Tax=Lederbergia lenta TaxID=1467 RepID=A0A2X4WAJ2_LEDLE|nr:hypothetical protein [Lederbergia lenta]MCM3111377.1 hypothetical protein [Lederbergia lenta]MEC2325236.1 hypothetical protein [Lederbergia lenta]SQI55902.1 Uncharacterised protein [Lederbergia lenta]
MEQFLLFLIIGIISLVLNRKKEKPSEQQQRPVQRKQTAQPVHRHEEQRRDIARSPVAPVTQAEPTPSKRLEEVAEAMFTKAKPKIKSKQEEMTLQMEELKKKEEAHRLKVAQVQVVHSSNLDEKRKEGMSAFQSKDILNGIIMAEVLGAPRSKKPYRRRY